MPYPEQTPRITETLLLALKLLKDVTSRSLWAERG